MQDEERIHSPAFKDTLDNATAWVLGQFKAIITDVEQGRRHKCKVVNKAEVGLKWLPAFVDMYATRLQNSSWPQPKAEVRAEKQAAAREALEEYKQTITAARLEAMNGKEMREVLKRIQVKAKNLKFRDGSLRKAVAEALSISLAT